MEETMKWHFAALPVLAAFAVACRDGAMPTDQAGSEPSLNSSPPNARCMIILPPGVYANVEVPIGSGLCTMADVTVLGSVKVLPDARLQFLGGVVHGNVEGDKAEMVHMVGVMVGGHVQIKEGEAPNDLGFDVFLCGNTLTQGNIQVEKMAGSIIVGDPLPEAVGVPCAPNQLQKGNIKVEDNLVVTSPSVETVGLVIRGNQVAQNIQVFKNRGAGPKFVQLNTAGEAVQCKENDEPFVGTPNTAPKREDQCAP
jgi:hypothetical protein